MLKKKRKILKDIKKTNLFLFKLYDILKEHSYKDIILWKETKSILIKDRYKLTELVLPKFFKHKNYSSFVRQLNLYGFHKSKGLIKEGELFQHEILTKDSTKEQIEQMIKEYKSNKLNEKKEKEFITNNTSFNNYKSYENNLLKFFFEKNEEDRINIIHLKNEINNLKIQNEALINIIKNINSIFLGHNILLEKIMFKKYNSDNSDNTKNVHKSKNIKELFKKYLYYLKVYSPYLNIKKENCIFNKIQKTDSFKITTFDDSKTIKIFNSNISSINNMHDINNNSNFILNGYPIGNQRQNAQNFILNLLNNNSNSFIQGNNQNSLYNI